MRKYQWLIIVALIGCAVFFTSCDEGRKMMEPLLPDTEPVEEMMEPELTKIPEMMENPVGPVDVLIYTGSSWWISPENVTIEAETTKSLLQSEGIQVEIVKNTSIVSEWMLQTTNDDNVNVLIVYGVIPSSIYPRNNTQPDGSIAENWIESKDGDTILNHASYLGWNSDADVDKIDHLPAEELYGVDLGINRHGAMQNLMDNPEIDLYVGEISIPMVVTEDGMELTPSLVNFQTHRPVTLNHLMGDWFTERILASDTGDMQATYADPIIIRDGDRGRLAIVIQTPDQSIQKGKVAAEIIINYLLTPPMMETVKPPVEPMVEMEMEMPETTVDDTDPSLILYLSFDELDGNQAIDHSLYHNHGMLVGNPQLVDGKFGKALEFNGETDAVEVPHHNSLTVTEAVTVMAWIHTPRSHHSRSNWQGILAKGDQHPRSYSFYTERGGTLQLSLDNGDATTIIEVDGVPIPHAPGNIPSEGKFESNEWQHVAARIATGERQFWINGQKAGTSEVVTPFPGLADIASVLIGNTHEIDRNFLGLIDEVRIWNRALSEDEIIEQMQRGFAAE